MDMLIFDLFSHGSWLSMLKSLSSFNYIKTTISLLLNDLSFEIIPIDRYQLILQRY